MQSINYRISGFKCFKDKTFELKDVTLLTGSNGTGKSSFIQALLLIRSAIEKNCVDSSSLDYVNKIWKNNSISLNGPYILNLGSVYDIFNENEKVNNRVQIELGEEIFSIDFPSESEPNDRCKVNLETEFSNDNISFWRKQKFYYLHTERLGPRLGVDSIYTEFPHCYYRGENVGEVISKYGVSLKISDDRLNTNVRSPNLQQQIDGWLSFICPGTIGVQVKQQDLNRYQIIMRSSAANNNILAPNIGFGISYSLPIIVNGLIAEKDSVFIVENPEAHLHPKGQSNMGFFLGMVAASGVRIIVETHSEHIVNGIRKASLYKNSLHPENVGIYFFEDFTTNENQTQEIVISEDGNLESFPKDFFDQVGQDMAELFKLKNLYRDDS